MVVLLGAGTALALTLGVVCGGPRETAPQGRVLSDSEARALVATSAAVPQPPAKSPEQEEAELRAALAAAVAKARPAEKAFIRAVRKLDPRRELFSDVAIDPRRPSRVRLLVTAEWDASPKALRMRAAEALWQMWAEANAANVDSPDESRISFVVPSGREVGGSRVWAGSLIWVDD